MPPSAGHVMADGNRPPKHEGGDEDDEDGAGVGGGLTVISLVPRAPPPNATAVIVARPTASATTAPDVDEAVRTDATPASDEIQEKETPAIGAFNTSNACAVSTPPP